MAALEKGLLIGDDLLFHLLRVSQNLASWSLDLREGRSGQGDSFCHFVELSRSGRR